MLETERAVALFATANATYAQAMKHLASAIEELDRTELEKSVGKTWDAVLQATNALILARTGVEVEVNPLDDRKTYVALAQLPERDEALKKITRSYSILENTFFTTVLCQKDIEPVSLLIKDIRATADYLREAEALANGG